MRATIVSTSNLKPVSITFPCLSFFSVLSWSGDSDKGVTAYEKGDYKTALREWTPLAEQGVARAQYNLGFMVLLVIGASIGLLRRSHIVWGVFTGVSNPSITCHFDVWKLAQTQRF